MTLEKRVFKKLHKKYRYMFKYYDKHARRNYNIFKKIKKKTPKFLLPLLGKIYSKWFEHDIYPIEYGFCVDDGWLPIVEQCIHKIAEIDKDKKAILFQVKEKFGKIRIHFEKFYPEFRQIISAHESMASYVCECCGAPGELRPKLSWLQTLCKDCYKEKLKNE